MHTNVWSRAWKNTPTLGTRIFCIQSQMKDIHMESYGGFQKWWYPTTMGFPTKNDHFGVFRGYPNFWNHPYGCIFFAQEFSLNSLNAFRWMSTKKAQNPCHCLKPAANRSSRTVRTWAQKQVLLVLSSHRQRCWVPCHSNASHQPADASACTTWWRKLWIRGIDNNNFFGNLVLILRQCVRRYT